MRALLLLVAVTACAKSDKQWIDTRATQLHVGSLEADIPPNWRDVNELADKSKLPKLLPGTRTLLPESLREMGEISVFPINAVIKADDCANLGAVIQAQGEGRVVITRAEGANFSGSPGCMMDMAVDGHGGKLRVITPAGGSTVGVRCIGHAKDLDYACDKVLYGLHVTPAK
jgi:hypothetical protein